MAKPRKRKSPATPRKRKSTFPYGEKYDKVLKQAEEIARARYHTDLRSTAKEIVEERLSRDSLERRISEEAESAVIYTKNALDIMVESDNWLIIEEEGMEFPSTDVTGAVTQIAYWAYKRDLEEYVQAFRNEDEDEVE